MRKFLLSATILACSTTSTFATNIVGSDLTATVASGLTEDQCANLVGPQNIPVAVIPMLPNICVKNMGLRFSNDQLAALTTNQVSSLTSDWLLSAGQAKQVILLTQASSNAVFRILSLNMVAANQIATLTSDQLNGLTANEWGMIPSSYFRALKPAQMDSLRSDQISGAFDQWTSQQMKNLTPDQIGGLPAYQTSGLVSSFPSWTNDQIHALTRAQLATIPEAFGYPWFKDVFTILLRTQIDSLPDQAVFHLAKSKNEVQKLPDALIATLTDETVTRLARANRLQNLSEGQLKSLAVTAVMALKSQKLLSRLSTGQVAVLPSTDLTLMVKLDATCINAGMTLTNLSAFYTTEARQPADNKGTWINVGDCDGGQFTVPFTATYVRFNRIEMPPNVNFYGVNQTTFTVSIGASYTVTCFVKN